MKHVIVIETVDPSEPRGKLLDKNLATSLLSFVESRVEQEHGVCFVRGIFNQHSAIDAIHEMFNVPRGDIEL